MDYLACQDKLVSIMVTDEIKRIYKNISAVYDGTPWYGDNLLSLLSDITADMAVKRLDKLNHSVAEIVCHMTAWRYFIVEKIKGNADYEVWDTELNWRNITSMDEKEWQIILDDLLKSQKQLLQGIEQIPESMLTAQVQGRKYNFRLMLQGIAQHDIYHAGQISMIKKLIS